MAVSLSPSVSPSVSPSAGSDAYEINDTYLASDSNLQGYWRLESDGTDESDNSYTLTGTGSPTHSAGKFGNGADFEKDSSQDYTIANASCANLEISGSQTWSCWVKLESIGKHQTAIGKFDGTNAYHRLHVNSNNTVTFRIAGLTTNEQVASTAVVTTGAWYHLCGVYDSSASKIKVFVNGAKTELVASGSATDTNGGFSVGNLGDQASGSLFDGIVDDAAIFNRALTDAEVQFLYYGGIKKISGVVNQS